MIYSIYGPGERSRETYQESSLETNMIYTVDGVYQYDWPHSYELLNGKEINDQVIPNYHKNSANGMLYNNPCWINESSHSAEPFVGKNVWNSGRSKWEGTWFKLWGNTTVKPGFLTLPDYSSDLLAVFTEASAKVSSAEFDALIFVAEFDQLALMLLKTAKRIRTLAIRLWKERDKLLTAMAAAVKPSSVLNHWMEYRYGWRLLWYDLLAIKKAIDKLSAKDPYRKSFRAKGLITVDESDSVTEWGDIAQWDRSITGVIDIKGGVLAEAKVNAYPDIFGFTKLPQAIWDLTRLSFVVDWVFNVADTIAMWVPDPYWERRLGWVTAYHALTYKLTCTSFVGTGFEMSDLASETLSVAGYCRIPVEVDDQPVIPTVVNKLSWAKFVDAIAILDTEAKPTIKKVGRFLENYEPKVRK